MYSNKTIVDILKFLNDNINTKININELSKIFMYDKAYLMRLIKKELNITIIDYVNSVRIYNSIKKLKSDSNLLHISLNNGFNSLEYFSETFKNIIGVNPSTFRKFLKLDRSITLDEFVECTNSMSNLNIFINRIDKYIKNIKTNSNYKKVLTIFK